KFADRNFALSSADYFLFSFYYPTFATSTMANAPAPAFFLRCDSSASYTLLVMDGPKDSVACASCFNERAAPANPLNASTKRNRVNLNRPSCADDKQDAYPTLESASRSPEAASGAKSAQYKHEAQASESESPKLRGRQAGCLSDEQEPIKPPKTRQAS
ncbi:MAG: hypothetical protein AAF394_09285, partial [Planctomycetota bacterium]